MRTFFKIIFRYRGVQGRPGASRGVHGQIAQNDVKMIL